MLEQQLVPDHIGGAEGRKAAGVGYPSPTPRPSALSTPLGSVSSKSASGTPDTWIRGPHS